jgi:hypothetical protein
MQALFKKWSQNPILCPMAALSGQADLHQFYYTKVHHPAKRICINFITLRCIIRISGFASILFTLRCITIRFKMLIYRGKMRLPLLLMECKLKSTRVANRCGSGFCLHPVWRGQPRFKRSAFKPNRCLLHTLIHKIKMCNPALFSGALEHNLRF